MSNSKHCLDEIMDGTLRVCTLPAGHEEPVEHQYGRVVASCLPDICCLHMAAEPARVVGQPLAFALDRCCRCGEFFSTVIVGSEVPIEDFISESIKHGPFLKSVHQIPTPPKPQIALGGPINIARGRNGR